MVLCIVLTTAYVYFLSPTAYKIRNVSYGSVKVNDALDGMTIAYVSDLNLSSKEDLEYFNKFIDKLNNQAFDLFVFGGDLYEGKPFEKDEVTKILKTVKAKYGKFAVLGDKDKTYAKQLSSIYDDCSIELVTNKTRNAYYKDQKIHLSFGDEIKELKLDKKILSINFSHQPDTFKNYAGKVDLQIAGHSLGGSYFVPLYGGIMKDKGFETYKHGRHVLKNSTLIISNGAKGTVNIPYKFLACNEALLINLKTKKNA